ncbi:hypothetical protein [Allocoleopsis sp.]|uniref:hypothetical protein n=1 Tax=Allocoleopsis sp. TaxID=3088169 RepID=UPI002FCF9C74
MSLFAEGVPEGYFSSRRGARYEESNWSIGVKLKPNCYDSRQEYLIVRRQRLGGVQTNADEGFILLMRWGHLSIKSDSEALLRSADRHS